MTESITVQQVYGTTISTDRANGKRIINHLLTKNWWFCAWQKEGTLFLTFSPAVEIDYLRKKLSGVAFEIDA